MTIEELAARVELMERRINLLDLLAKNATELAEEVKKLSGALDMVTIRNAELADLLAQLLRGRKEQGQ